MSRLTAALVVVAVAAGMITPAARAAFPGENGKIALSRSSHPQPPDVYSIDPDGGALTRLTDDRGIDMQPAWSPDGTKIAFVSDRDDPDSDQCSYFIPLGLGRLCNLEVYVMGADGSNQTRVTSSPAVDYQPSWSPDGTKIVFSSNRDDPAPTTCGFPNPPCDYDIYAMDAGGSNVTRIIGEAENEHNPAWSPDGSRIAYDCAGEYRGGVECIDSPVKVRIADGSGAATSVWGDFLCPDFAAGYQPDWSPDSTRVTFISWEDCDGFFIFDVTTANPDGSGVLSPLADIAEHNIQNPVFSPDGTRIALDDGRVLIMNTDGSDLHPITPDDADYSQPSWQPLPNRVPDCSTVTATPSVIQAAAPQLRLVSVAGATDPDGDAVSLAITGLTQDEPLTGGADRTSPDAFSKQLTRDPRVASLLDNGPNELYLRAERRNNGDGRVYRISFSGSDGKGGSCTGTAKVSVPRKAGVAAIDSAPPSYDSFGS